MIIDVLFDNKTIYVGSYTRVKDLFKFWITENQLVALSKLYSNQTWYDTYARFIKYKTKKREKEEIKRVMLDAFGVSFRYLNTLKRFPRPGNLLEKPAGKKLKINGETMEIVDIVKPAVNTGYNFEIICKNI